MIMERSYYNLTARNLKRMAFQLAIRNSIANPFSKDEKNEPQPPLVLAKLIVHHSLRHTRGRYASPNTAGPPAYEELIRVSQRKTPLTSPPSNTVRSLNLRDLTKAAEAIISISALFEALVRPFVNVGDFGDNPPYPNNLQTPETN